MSETSRLPQEADDAALSGEPAPAAAAAPESTGFQRIGPLTLIPSALAEFGVDAADVLRACGLPARALDDAEGVIPYTKLGEIFAASQAATHCEHFGLTIAQRSEWVHLGAIGALLRNAPTLGALFDDVAAHHHRTAEGGMIYFLPRGDVTSLCYAVYRSGKPQWAPFVADTAIAIASQIARALAGVDPVEVQLARRAPPDAAPYTRHFRAPVRFDSEKSALVFAKSDLETPIPGADPDARLQIQRQIEQYWAASPPGVVEQARRAVFPHLLSGKISLSRAAQILAMQPRTLNRRLEQQGASFLALVENLRYELARQLLANTDIPITQISDAFGYSAISAFGRSFRRWSGLTPSEWREQLRC